MKPVLIYCYDAWCNWCYAFSPVIKKIVAHFDLPVEVLSGGMIITDTPKPVSVMAAWFVQNCQTVTAHTGIQFGNDYLWHMNNPDWSDWFPSSEKPAIAQCIFKEYLPDRQVEVAADLQYALQFEGRDLGDDEAYRHLLKKYAIPDSEFYTLLKDPAFKEKAYQEFAYCKQLQVSGFPALYMQVSEGKMVQLTAGYTDYEHVQQQIATVMQEYNFYDSDHYHEPGS
jgi:Predicted protein-disulfide isomerase